MTAKLTYREELNLRGRLRQQGRKIVAGATARGDDPEAVYYVVPLTDEPRPDGNYSYRGTPMTLEEIDKIERRRGTS